MERFVTCTIIAFGAAACADIDGPGRQWPLAEPPAAPPDVASPQPDEVVAYDHQPTLERAIAAQWTEQNVGCVTTWLWWAFDDGGAFEAREETPNWEESDPGTMEVVWRADGDWSIDEYGTVEWAYETEWASVVHRRTLALVTGELAAAVSWLVPTEDALWPTGAFVPQTDDLRRFRSETYELRAYASSTPSESGVTVDLVLSASPQELADGAPCEMHLEAREPGGGVAAFEWTCEVSPHPETSLLVIAATGYASDWFAASEQWRMELDGRGFFAEFAEYWRADVLRTATVPLVIFDPAAPSTLVRPAATSVLGSTTP